MTESTEVQKAEEKIPVIAGEFGLQLRSLDEIWSWSAVVLASGIAPKGLEKQASIAVVTEHGLELGMRPMQALQSICIINGRPCVFGDAIPGLVFASGKCLDFAESFEGEWGKDTFSAVCIVRRARMSEPVRQEFSIEDAKRAGLWDDKKKENWQKYPKRMLQMRARAFACRDAFPDVLKGLSVAEEAQDIIDVTPRLHTQPMGLSDVPGVAMAAPENEVPDEEAEAKRAVADEKNRSDLLKAQIIKVVNEKGILKKMDDILGETLGLVPPDKMASLSLEQIEAVLGAVDAWQPENPT